MKPFNLEAAKAGKPLVTRDGRKVTEFHHFKKVLTPQNQPCVYVVDGEIHTCDESGRYRVSEDERDIFLADEEVTVWVNVYEGEEVHGLCVGSMHETQLYAELAARVSQRKGYIFAFPLTIKI